MKRVVKLIAILIGLLVALVAVRGVVGATLPRDHESTRYAVIHQPVETVWSAIADFEHLASWRTDVKAVERLPDRNGHPVWNQITSEGNWPLEIAESSSPTRLITVVADSSQGFGGRWIYVLAPEDGGTRVSITEAGWIANPLFRFMARFVFGLDSTKDGYLGALGRKFGETVAPATP